MAAPIIVYDRVEQRPNPRNPVQAVFHALFVYPVTPAVQNFLGTTQVLTPSEGLPLQSVSLMTSGERAQLDTGETAFEDVSITQAVGQPVSELAAIAETMYPGRRAAFLTAAAVRFQHVGRRITVSGVAI